MSRDLCRLGVWAASLLHSFRLLILLTIAAVHSVACGTTDQDLPRSRRLLKSLAQIERLMRREVDPAARPLSLDSLLREAARRLEKDPIPSPDFRLKRPRDLEVLAFVERSVDRVCARLREPDVPARFRCDIPPLKTPIRHPAFVIFMPLIERTSQYRLQDHAEYALRDRHRMLTLVVW